MARILFAYELGGGFGHLNRLLAIAARVRDNNIVTFVVPTKAAGMSMLRKNQRSDIIVRPGLDWKALVPPSEARATPTYTLADTLSLFGFSKLDRLMAAVRFWRGVIRETNPDIIISDFAPSLKLAAGDSIPVIVVGSGYTIPPAGSPLPPIRPWKNDVPTTSRARESELLSAVDQICAALRIGSFEHFVDVLHGTRSFVCTLTELDPYRAYRKDATFAPFNVPDVTVGPPLSERTAPSVFVYLSAAHPQLRMTLEALNKSSLATHMYVSGIDPQKLAKMVRNHVAVHARPADFATMVPRTRVLLHHGGLGTAYAGLAAGTVQLILPRQLEQLVTAYGIAKIGAGRVMTQDVTGQSLTDCLLELSGNERYSEATRNVAMQLAGRRREDSLGAIVESCNQLIGK